MKIYLVTGAVFAAAWIVAYVTFIHPLLLRYAVTARVVERLDAAEGDMWRKVTIWFEAKKTLACAFVMSLLATMKGATDSAVSTVGNLSPTDIAPLQDKSLWSAFFGDIWSFHIIAALGLLAAFLTLKGKVAAAQIVPKV